MGGLVAGVNPLSLATSPRRRPDRPRPPVPPPRPPPGRVRGGYTVAGGSAHARAGVPFQHQAREGEEKRGGNGPRARARFSTPPLHSLLSILHFPLPGFPPVTTPSSRSPSSPTPTLHPWLPAPRVGPCSKAPSLRPPSSCAAPSRPRRPLRLLAPSSSPPAPPSRPRPTCPSPACNEKLPRRACPTSCRGRACWRGWPALTT